jgi:hypothetical protein
MSRYVTLVHFHIAHRCWKPISVFSSNISWCWLAPFSHSMTFLF